MRRMALLLLVVGTTLVVFTTNATGSSDRTSCPNGFFKHAVPQDIAGMADLPRILDGIAANEYAVADLVTLGNAINANGDPYFCLKEISNLTGNSGKNWGYYYGARDNDSAAS